MLETRESKKRPQQGIVTIRTTGKNRDGVVVCTFERSVLVWKRGFGNADD